MFTRDLAVPASEGRPLATDGESLLPVYAEDIKDPNLKIIDAD